jgi:hypothetical protein
VTEIVEQERVLFTDFYTHCVSIPSDSQVRVRVFRSGEKLREPSSI